MEIDYNYNNIVKLIPMLRELRQSEIEYFRIIAIDLQQAIANCGLSGKQRLVINLISRGLQQISISHRLKIPASTVNYEYHTACMKICIFMREKR